MKKRLTSLLLLIPMVLGAVLLPTSGVFGSLEDDKAAVEKKIEAFRQEIAAKEGEVDAILAEVDSVNQEIAVIEGQIAALDAEKAAIEANIVAKQANVDEAKAKFDSMKGNVYSRARQMYETGEINVLQILLDAEDLTQMGNTSEYYRLIKQEDAKHVEAVRQERLNLETQKKALEEEKVVLEDNKKAVAVQESALSLEKKKLEAAQSVVEGAIAKKTEQLVSEEQALGSINAEIEAATIRFAAEIAKLEQEAAAAAAPPPVQTPSNDVADSGSGSETGGGTTTPTPSPVPTPPPASNGFTWPVPSSYYVTSEYGYRWGTLHRGMDIGAPKGAAIVAADRGVVLAAGYTGDGFGNKVVIRHASGLITLYGHMDFVSVSAGQTVERGQYIGGVGNTGYSFGDHLHFQVSTTGNMYDGVDPRNYF